MLQLVLAAAEGGQFLGYHVTQPCDVLYFAAEDDDARIQSRLATMGVAMAPPNVSVVTGERLRTLAAKFCGVFTFDGFLDQYLDGHPRTRLVVVDTETTVLQTWRGERSAVKAARATEADYETTRAFDTVALRRGAVILLVNHAAKRKNGEHSDIHELINRTNTAMAGCSGSIVLADPPGTDPMESKDKTRILGVRGRDLRDDLLLAVQQREEMASFFSLGPYTEVRQTQAEEEILLALEELQSGLGDGEYITAADIADQLGKRKDTVKRAISRLVANPARKSWRRWHVVSKPGRNGGIRLDPM